MNYISTKKTIPPVDFLHALQKGLAEDGGLFVPEKIPGLEKSFFRGMSGMSTSDIAFPILKPYTEENFSEKQLREVIDEAFTFEIPLVHLHDQIFVLELFHGPTLAFKDFGARFMSRAFSALRNKREQEITILVATSGDTGSAVAQGFYNVPGINVCLLYPSGKVSDLQEKQLTTSGGNVTALEVQGTFDDCQKIVKRAFSDPELNNQLKLSSANSINIGRLLPQMVYYGFGFAQLNNILSDPEPVFCVPSGNFGNITAGLMLQFMGLPARRFIAATNINDVFTGFLDTGKLNPHPSVKTLSNAMDVGNPSNLERIRHFFRDDVSAIRSNIWSHSVGDDQTTIVIDRVYKKTGYTFDPHTAVGYAAGLRYREATGEKDVPVIILGTAHPAKFKDVVEPIIETELTLPVQLKEVLHKEKRSIQIAGDYGPVKDFLLNRYAS